MYRLVALPAQFPKLGRASVSLPCAHFRGLRVQRDFAAEQHCREAHNIAPFCSSASPLIGADCAWADWHLLRGAHLIAHEEKSDKAATGATALSRTSTFRGEDRKVRNRRISPVAAHSGDRLLSEPTAGTQPCRREPLFMPLTGHPARRRGMPESGGYLPLGLWVSTVPYPIPERTFDDVSTSRSATAGTRQQRASRRPRLPNESFSDLLSGAEKPGGISAFLPKLHSVLL